MSRLNPISPWGTGSAQVTERISTSGMLFVTGGKDSRLSPGNRIVDAVPQLLRHLSGVVIPPDELKARPLHFFPEPLVSVETIDFFREVFRVAGDERFDPVLDVELPGEEFGDDA